MSYVIPTAARYTLDDAVDTLKFSIPARKHWFFLLFSLFWLIFWAGAEIMVGGMILSGLVAALTGSLETGDGIFPGVFMLFWFTFWTLGGTSILLSVLWQIIGIETISVSATGIFVRRQVMGIGRSKAYDAQYIQGLRVVPSEPYLLRQRRNPYSLWFFNFGALAFDYGAKTFRIGGDLEEAEARDMLATIQSRFPQYAPVTK
ncbi:MAG: hypothetical protein HY862_04970 [Chloroflexi bacterium]|nr:hypothetical protein [Chloroflexota bacterium]